MAHEFDWDQQKARTNRAKHNVDFSDAQRAFDDPFAIDWLDDRENYGEDRFITLGMVEDRLLHVSYAMPDDKTIRIISALERGPMRSGNTTRAKHSSPTKPAQSATDWSAFDAMTEEEVLAAAVSDRDAQPLTDADMKRMKRTPQVKVIRRAFRMSQEEFARTFRIPIGTLRDWEQGRVEPDQAARAYLKVIARNPKAVREALGPAA